jgi:NitT/TauT family transport system substrate-binding protein
VVNANRRRVLAAFGGSAAALALRRLTAQAATQEPVAAPDLRIGILKFGSVAWQLDVIGRHGLDRAENLSIEIVELASNQATLVALQAARVDVIVSDLLWVARQRADGADWSFVPYSSALGAVVVPAPSSIRSLGDLSGHHLGIAGGPLDKSWLLLRLLSRRRGGRDLDGLVDKVFGAPPLLAEQLTEGRLDAVLTFWQFAARLEAQGARRLLGMDAVMTELGITEKVPLVGYVLSQGWAGKNAAVTAAFFRAIRRADEILANSDAEWQAIAPLTGAGGEAELERLRDAYRLGIPDKTENGSRAAAEHLFELFAEIGGEPLVGPSRTLPPGTFLDGIQS